jgi:hypothetical protein
MTYVPNADDATQPTDSVIAETATLEFQAVKAKINLMVGISTSGQSLPALYTLVTSIIAGLPIYTGAGVVTPMAGDAPLTSASKQLQQLHPNTFGCRLILPPGNTLPTAGGNVFIAQNITDLGSFPVQVMDSSTTTPVGWLRPGEDAAFDLGSIAVANGNWKARTGDRGADNGISFWGAPAVSYDTTQAFPVTVVSCSAQYGIVNYWDGTNGNWMAYGATDGTTTFGAAFTTASAHPCVGAPVDATHALFLSTNIGGSPSINVFPFVQATLAVTSGSISTVALPASMTGIATTIERFSASTFLLGETVSSSMKIVVASVAAGVVTLGTNSATAAPASYSIGPIECAQLTATLFHYLALNSQPPSSLLNYGRGTIAGTTPSQGTPTLISARGGYSTIVALSATTSLAVYQESGSNTGALYGAILTDNGATVSLVETKLTVGRIGAQPISINDLTCCALTKQPNSTIVATFIDGVNGIGSIATVLYQAVVRVVNGVPTLGPLTRVPVPVAPSITTIGSGTGSTVSLSRSINGSTLLGVQGLVPVSTSANALRTVFQPVLYS